MSRSAQAASREWTAVPDTEFAAPPKAAVAEVADNLIGLLRSFQKTRARMMAAADHDVEWAAHVLLRCIAREGPMRASAVAEVLQSDPSTVSRQVASLVKDGLVQRLPDPLDGRASLLVLTAKADSVLADHERIRLEYFARMLDGWDAVDLRQFADLLERFTTAYESTDDDWISERMTEAARPRSAT